MNRLLFLVLMLGLLASAVGALGVHYELDKQYYYPGDVGELTLEISSESLDPDRLVFQAYTNISGIGDFDWNPVGLAEAPDLPPGVHAYELARGQGMTIRIPFKIPLGTKAGAYQYTWVVVMGPAPYSGEPFSKSDTLKVYEAGEVPSGQCILPSALMAMLVILAVLKR